MSRNENNVCVLVCFETTLKMCYDAHSLGREFILPSAACKCGVVRRTMAVRLLSRYLSDKTNF